MHLMESVDKRKFTRFQASDNAFVAFNGERKRVAQISDISLGGLSISYSGEKIADDELRSVDIYLSDNGFRLSDIGCSVIYDAKNGSNGSNGKGAFRCGLCFAPLETENRNKLKDFLKNHAIAPVTALLSKPRTGPRVREKAMALFADFLLLTIAFYGMQLVKRGGFELPALYRDLFGVFFLSWLIVSLVMKKYSRIFRRPFSESLVLLVKSNAAITFMVSFSVVLWTGLATVSRVQTFGVCAAFFLLEVIGFSLYYLFIGRRANGRQISRTEDKKTSLTISYPLMLIDAALVFAAFMAMNYVKRGSFSIPPQYDQAIFVMYGLWLISYFVVQKFDTRHFKTSYLAAIGHCLKATVFMGATLAVLIFAFRLFYYSRLQLFGTLGVFLLFELGIYYLYYLYSRYGKLEKDIETAAEVREILERQEADKETEGRTSGEERRCRVREPVETKLDHALEFFNPRLFDFIRETIDLPRVERRYTSVLSTSEIDDVEALDANGYRLLINLHKTNDVRWFNRYFLQVHSKLKNRGFFIGKAHTIGTHKRHYKQKYPSVIAKVFYAADFIWSRAFPKLPYTKKLYFAITKGRNRLVSKAEVFGRLYFCGFKVVADVEIDNSLYFVAQKVRKPATSKNPTFGPLVLLNRRGFAGQNITVYKFRTMYPYSEFLQEYVYENNNLESGGKFKNDFRVTDWGKYMRSTWLDELPMLYNWLKGDLKLFGVRPLSHQYLGLYSDELRELRKKVMPGLIPPFYADLPKTLPEIIESELRYIKSYMRSPVRTQLSYLWNSGQNIIMKGSRSN